MVSVLAFISDVTRAGSSLTGPAESWAATKIGNASGITASNRFIGYSVLGCISRIWDRRRQRPDLHRGPHEGYGSVRFVRSRARLTELLIPPRMKKPRAVPDHGV